MHMHTFIHIIHLQIFEIYSTFWPVYFSPTHKLFGSNVFLVGFSLWIHVCLYLQHSPLTPFLCPNILYARYVHIVVNDCKMDYAHFGARQEENSNTKYVRVHLIQINHNEYIRLASKCLYAVWNKLSGEQCTFGLTIKNYYMCPYILLREWCALIWGGCTMYMG